MFSKNKNNIPSQSIFAKKPTWLIKDPVLLSISRYTNHRHMIDKPHIPYFLKQNKLKLTYV